MEMAKNYLHKNRWWISKLLSNVLLVKIQIYFYVFFFLIFHTKDVAISMYTYHELSEYPYGKERNMSGVDLI